MFSTVPIIIDSAFIHAYPRFTWERLENQPRKQLHFDQCTKRNLGVFVVVQTTLIAFAGQKMGDLAKEGLKMW